MSVWVKYDYINAKRQKKNHNEYIHRKWNKVNWTMKISKTIFECFFNSVF